MGWHQTVILAFVGCAALAGIAEAGQGGSGGRSEAASEVLLNSRTGKPSQGEPDRGKRSQAENSRKAQPAPPRQPAADQPGARTITLAGAPQPWPVCHPLTAAEHQELGHFDPSNPIYPVTYRFDHHALAPGASVLAVRILECDGPSSFAVLAEGTFAGRNANGQDIVRFARNLAVVNSYNQSGDAWNFAASAASYDGSDTWCIPAREFCTKPARPTSFGLSGPPGTELLFWRHEVFATELGLPLALQAVITERCGRRPSPSCEPRSSCPWPAPIMNRQSLTRGSC